MAGNALRAVHIKHDVLAATTESKFRGLSALKSGHLIRDLILYQYPDIYKVADFDMPPALTSTVGYALKKAQHILRLKMDESLRKLALTAPQYAALAALSEEPGLSGAAVARRCFVTPQTMTGIISNLVDAGLIAREPDPEHGRILKTRLTVRGADLLRQAHRAVETIEAKMVAELDAAEREALADLLGQCATALEL
jgi:DNA-binding MarR family transcriptional regulator